MYKIIFLNTCAKISFIYHSYTTWIDIYTINNVVVYGFLDKSYTTEKLKPLLRSVYHQFHTFYLLIKEN